MIARIALVALLVPAGAATAQQLYDCPVEGRPQLFLGDAAPEGCTAAPGAGLARADPVAPGLADRLEAQDRRIERLERQMRALVRQRPGPDLDRPSPSPRLSPPTADSLSSTDQRRRDLGQDLDRKLDALR